jgi:AbrB family looped-hinge helix DNA binding protein
MERIVRDSRKPEAEERVYRAKVGERGQITIPKPLRDRYGLKKGVEVEIVADGQALTVQHGQSFQERLMKYVGILDIGMSTDEYMETIRDR